MYEVEKYQQRLRSLRAIQHIIRSMKAVSSIRWRRARKKLKTVENYSDNILRELNLATNLSETKITAGKISEMVEANISGIIIISSDKGLCGGFNIGITRFAETIIENLQKEGKKVKLITLGRYAKNYFKDKSYEILLSLDLSVAYGISYEKSRELCEKILGFYEEGEISELVVVFNKFKSFARSERLVLNILPPELEPAPDPAALSFKYLLGSDIRGVEELLFFEYLTSRFHLAIAESVVAEHAARMQAMTAAEDNIKETQKEMVLKLNTARQESITQEILDIVTGVRALGGI